MLDPETSFACVECGITYTMTEKEYLRFKELSAQKPDFKMPKRCADCRRARRLQQGNLKVPQRPHSVMGPAPLARVPEAVPFQKAADVVVQAEPEGSVEPRKEINFVLATKDFDDLVHGRPVVWSGVRVVLADIGFGNMRKAIEDAEIERARKLVKSNGH